MGGPGDEEDRDLRLLDRSEEEEVLVGRMGRTEEDEDIVDASREGFSKEGDVSPGADPSLSILALVLGGSCSSSASAEVCRIARPNSSSPGREALLSTGGRTSLWPGPIREGWMKGRL